MGMPVTEVNIWEDPSAASVVRGAAHGNETVPTVIIGTTAFVNPSVRSVVEASQRLDPPVPLESGMLRKVRRLQTLRTVQWSLVATAIVGSLVANSAGHAGLSWGLIAGAVVGWGVFRIFNK